MSALRLWPCLDAVLTFAIFISSILPDIATGLSGQSCPHPVIPEHGGFYCKPSPCRGFTQKSFIYYFCETGYSLPGRVHRSKCLKGQWTPSVPTCVPNTAGHAKHEDRNTSSMPSIATTAVGVSIFLLTATACMVIKSRFYPCHSQSRRSSDQVDLVVDGFPVSLPTYEEAIYGSWGQRLPPFRGPTRLLLASSEHSPLSSLIQSDSSCSAGEVNHSVDMLTQPPPYEEVPVRVADDRNEEDARVPNIALTAEKDN
ncbi:sushi domain-containing protein 6 [Electrophorus electricus]|uniref:Sushi domain-containing protein n=1 Tax=Electrophorus electricus TaxID=8005 RepID=A0A4W4DM76_ELEEL|nr:sushi domain-containing protein 6 [Electrophorus electricus]